MYVEPKPFDAWAQGEPARAIDAVRLGARAALADRYGELTTLADLLLKEREAARAAERPTQGRGGRKPAASVVPARPAPLLANHGAGAPGRRASVELSRKEGAGCPIT